MNKLFAVVLVLCMLVGMTACDTPSFVPDEPSYEEPQPEHFAIPLGDTGVKIEIPPEVGFESYESEINDYYGGTPSGAWRVIVNAEPKTDYPDCTLADYNELSAMANEGTAGQDADGNYIFTYTNVAGADEVYSFYTSTRESADQYYRIAFYCFADDWDTFSSQFAEWSRTIVVE